jgi:hypothetical protein
MSFTVSLTQQSNLCRAHVQQQALGRHSNMWGRKGVTWEIGAELEDIRKATDYGGHLSFNAQDEGAFKLRRTKTDGKEDSVGRRVMEFAAGDIYEGELDAGLKHGQGTYSWGNGARCCAVCCGCVSNLCHKSL